MPLYEYACDVQHVTEHYYASSTQAPPTQPCRQCGQEAGRMVSRFVPLQYFSESSGRVISNLAPGRVIHSHGEHQRLMKERGLEPATTWHTSNMKQTDGLKTRAQREAQG